MRKNCCVNVVRTQPETQAALWHESMTEPVTQSMEIQALPLFLQVDNRLLKLNDGSREYRRSRASSRSPGGSESQSPLSQPNFLCPPSLAHSASFCPAWGNQATVWTDARLKSRYPWDPAIPHQFSFQQWGCGYTGHILHKLLVCHQSKPVISRLLAFHRYSTWSVTLSLAFQTDVTERCQKCVCGSDTNGCDLFTDEIGFVFQWAAAVRVVIFCPGTNACATVSAGTCHMIWPSGRNKSPPVIPWIWCCSAVGYVAVANANREHAAGNILILYH